MVGKRAVMALIEYDNDTLERSPGAGYLEQKEMWCLALLRESGQFYGYGHVMGRRGAQRPCSYYALTLLVMLPKIQKMPAHILRQSPLEAEPASLVEVAPAFSPFLFYQSFCFQLSAALKMNEKLLVLRSRVTP